MDNVSMIFDRAECDRKGWRITWLLHPWKISPRITHLQQQIVVLNYTFASIENQLVSSTIIIMWVWAKEQACWAAKLTCQWRRDICCLIAWWQGIWSTKCQLLTKEGTWTFQTNILPRDCLKYLGSSTTDAACDSLALLYCSHSLN